MGFAGLHAPTRVKAVDGYRISSVLSSGCLANRIDPTVYAATRDRSIAMVNSRDTSVRGTYSGYCSSV